MITEANSSQTPAATPGLGALPFPPGHQDSRSLAFEEGPGPGCSQSVSGRPLKPGRSIAGQGLQEEWGYLPWVLWREGRTGRTFAWCLWDHPLHWAHCSAGGAPRAGIQAYKPRTLPVASHKVRRNCSNELQPAFLLQLNNEKHCVFKCRWGGNSPGTEHSHPDGCRGCWKVGGAQGSLQGLSLSLQPCSCPR